MASILILSVAIIPMVAMFDMGLNSATRGSNYDKARTLAKKQMEIVQSLSYTAAKNGVPNAPCSFNSSGLCETANLQVPNSEDPGNIFDPFRYKMRKQYVNINAAESDFSDVNEDAGYMKVSVTVSWGGAEFSDNSYTTTSIKAK